MSTPEYLADRIPVIPLAVHIGERIFAVHVEGEAPEDANWTVTAVGPADEPGTVRIAYLDNDNDGEAGSRVLRNGFDWVSVRPGGALPARTLLEVA